MRGKVKKLLTDKKCGFIMGEDQQDYFFHATVLKGVVFEELKEGTDVSFIGVGSQRGLRASEVMVGNG